MGLLLDTVDGLLDCGCFGIDDSSQNPVAKQAQLIQFDSQQKPTTHTIAGGPLRRCIRRWISPC